LPQCETLCNAIRAAGGEAIGFPTIEIQALCACLSATYDLAIFVSVNAVQHGIALFADQPDIKLAAIGRATAAALKAAQRPAHIVPDAESNSETLLAHPELTGATLRRAVIVRGDGGRELLRETLIARGIEVHSCEVYRRAVPNISPAALAALEQHWADNGIDAVTLTSVETLQNLLRLLSARSRAWLHTATLIVASERIARAARELGLAGPIVNARGADDEAMLGALINWHTRARADLVCGLD
jgi:uroporphyrinogen-III synthase